jgi:hypothetical protein
MALNLTTAPDVADAVAVSSRISEAEARLRAALLAGDSTRAIHEEIATLRAEAARIAAQDDAAKAEAAAEAARARQERVSETATIYVRDIAQRLESRMAALAPPPSPTPTTTRTPPR